MCTLRMNRTERGSALLVTLMVVVGLSLLGLGFVAISETESSISINERNYAQALSVAEAGAKTAVEWFQSPSWAETNLLLPLNNETTYPNMKRIRTVTTSSGVRTGTYKPPTLNPPALLFDKPYKPDFDHRLYGDEARADVVINAATTGTFLDTFNARLFNDKLNGEVTEIRVFAPPILGGTLNANGFWEGGTRYGVASIKVTAQKRADDGSGRVIAERSVKIVVTEWPFPGPQGPVQSNANISTGGSFGVHWGRMTAQGNMEVFKEENSLPWHDPWNLVKYEHGFESRTAYEWRPGFPVAAGTILHPSSAAIFATPALSRFGYTAAANGTTGTAEPAWSTTTAATPADNGINYSRRPSQQYPNRVTTFNDGDDSYNWLYELATKKIEDPWFNARARVDMTAPSGAGTSPFILNDYNDPAASEGCSPPQCNTGLEPRYNLFQGQDQNNPKSLKEVTFPKIDYEFWKSIAQQADSAGTGAKYLRWNRALGADNFLDRNNVSQRFWRWVNVPTGAPAGFYFFDTRNGLNPQFPGGNAYLTPAFAVNSSDANPFQMQGFIYMNVYQLNWTGVAGVDKNINIPGEPYRDIGYRKIDPATNTWATDSAGDFIIEGANNGKWDFQPLGGTAGFDVVLEDRTFVSADAGAPTSKTYKFPRTYDPTVCNRLNIGGPATDLSACSDPAEPYLNIRYDAASMPRLNQGDPNFEMGWGRTGDLHVARPKKLTTAGAIPVCGTNPELCTSTGYDREGGFERLQLNMIGILYIEGNYNATGNARFFGSLLVNGACEAGPPCGVIDGGTMEVYFDECLIKDCWEENFRNFPRVYISTHETDL